MCLEWGSPAKCKPRPKFELNALRGPLGLPVERDRYFKADKPLIGTHQRQGQPVSGGPFAFYGGSDRATSRERHRAAVLLNASEHRGFGDLDEAAINHVYGHIGDDRQTDIGDPVMALE